MSAALRRLLPQSLAGQLLLVTVLTLLLAQAINLALLISAQARERSGAIANSAATLIAEIDERLAEGEPIPQYVLSSPPGNARGGPPMRAGLLRRVIIADRPQWRAGMHDWPDMAERVSAQLADEGLQFRVLAARMSLPDRASRPALRDGRHRAPREAVAVAARLSDGRWVTVRARVPAPNDRLNRLIFGQTLILFVLLLGPLLFVAWRVKRPLDALARAAAELRPGTAQEPLPETGPIDMRTLTRAFNDMRSRIVTMLTEKDRMLGAIGHDLRTPLASLRLRVEQVEDDRLRDAMIASITDMAAMLEDILLLARTGQPRETVADTDIGALVDHLVEDYVALGRPVSRVGDVGSSVRRAIRPVALGRALRNLVDNAVAYGGAARLSVAQTADGLVLAVDDDGPGIPADQIEAMVEPFARAESSRNRHTGGSGLGLALARFAAQAEGGRLELVNRTEGGMSARIILPAV